MPVFINVKIANIDILSYCEFTRFSISLLIFDILSAYLAVNLLIKLILAYMETTSRLNNVESACMALPMYGDAISGGKINNVLAASNNNIGSVEE